MNKDLEILVGNDELTNGSEVICDEYIAKDYHVRAFCTEYRYPRCACNLGQYNAEVGT